MTDGYGVMDFSTLKKENQTSGTSEPLKGEVTVTEEALEGLIQSSQQKVTFLLVTSARVSGGAAFVDDVRAAMARHVGTIRLAIVDADTQPRVAAALRIQSMPAAMLLLKGQLQPLFEGIVGKDQLGPLLDNIAQVAAQEGLQTAEPVEEPDEPELPAEMAAAYSAMEAGDFENARTHFSSYLESHPGDSEAKKGIAMVALLKRTAGADLNSGREAAAANPADVDAQLNAADLDLLGGHVDDAFARLLTTFRDSDTEHRDVIRERLLELFDVVGPEDPRVGAARKRLSRLMF